MEKIAQFRASCCVIPTTYYPGDQIKNSEVGGACETYGERRDARRVSVRKTEGEGPLKRHRCRLLNITKMEIQEIRWGRGLD
jgi:hypothetical protein